VFLALDFNASVTAWSEIQEKKCKIPSPHLGISAYTETYPTSLKIARLAKK
jgi:hypothetical protein